MQLNRKIEILLFIVLSLAILSFRYYLLLVFSFKYTDSDQAIMWSGLKDYANGEFHEPRFYGQDYNTMLEAFLAIPLYKLGIPVYKAVTVVTTILTLFPFFVTALLTFRKKSTIAGLIILSIPLLMPVEYHLITSLSRGFVTGIFIASFGIFSLFYSDKRWAFFLCTFSSVLAYSISANAMLISLPCVLYLAIIQIKNSSFYFYSSIGIVLGGGIHFLLNHFYSIHPNYNLHSYQLNFSFELVLISLNKLDHFFNAVSPIFWNQGFIWLAILMLVGIVFLFKRRYEYALPILVIPVVFILTLGLSKIHDGSDSVFFTSSRMYLALPVLIALCISFVSKIKVSYFFFILPFIFISYTSYFLNNSIKDNTSDKRAHIVSVSKVQPIILACKKLNKICADRNIDLVVVLNHVYYDFINYGCQTCVAGFPRTIRPIYERRTWRLLEDENAIYKNILILDVTKMLTRDKLKMEEIETGNYLITENTLPTMELFKLLNIQVRKFK